MADTNQGYAYLKNYAVQSQELFDRYMESEFQRVLEISKVPAEAWRRFHKTAREGKRLRGALTILGYEVAGHSVDARILDVSMCIELFHAAILVQDDIMDQDSLRRGLPTIHTQIAEIAEPLGLKIPPLHYGESVAVCITDAAFYLSWGILLQSDFSDAQKVAAGKIYAQYIPNVAYGQILDLTTIGMSTLREDDVMTIYQHKTAEYTGVLPLLFGAALGGIEDQNRLNAIIEYGKAFGWAFQIQDDILGMFGNEEDTGKPSISDLREGKNTLLMLHLAHKGTLEDKDLLKHTLGNPNVTESDAQKVRDALKSSGSYDYVVNKGHEYVATATEHIPTITSDQRLQTTLRDLVAYMMERIK